MSERIKPLDWKWEKLDRMANAAFTLFGLILIFGMIGFALLMKPPPNVPDINPFLWITGGLLAIFPVFFTAMGIAGLVRSFRRYGINGRG